MKFFRVYQRSLELFKSNSKTLNPDSIFQTISKYTCYGSFVKTINKKKIQLQNGDIRATERELSTLLGRSCSAVHRLLNKMVNLGILIKNKLRKNIIIYSWSEIILNNNNDPFKTAIEISKKDENSTENTLSSRVSKYIKGKVIDFTEVTERMNAKIRAQGEQVHIMKDINLKKEKEREDINLSITNITREESIDDVSTVAFALSPDKSVDEYLFSFDPLYGENDCESFSEQELFQKVGDKMKKTFLPPYKTTPQKQKTCYNMQKVEIKKEDDEFKDKLRRTEKAITHFFGQRALMLFFQTLTSKGIDRVYNIFKGRTKAEQPEEIINQFRQDEYFVKLGIDRSLEKLLMRCE